MARNARAGRTCQAVPITSGAFTAEGSSERLDFHPLATDLLHSALWNPCSSSASSLATVMVHVGSMALQHGEIKDTSDRDLAQQHHTQCQC